MDMALASKTFSPSNATTERPIAKHDKAVANGYLSKYTYLNPRANDVSSIFICLSIQITLF